MSYLVFHTSLFTCFGVSIWIGVSGPAVRDTCLAAPLVLPFNCEQCDYSDDIKSHIRKHIGVSGPSVRDTCLASFCFHPVSSLRIIARTNRRQCSTCSTNVGQCVKQSCTVLPSRPSSCLLSQSTQYSMYNAAQFSTTLHNADTYLAPPSLSLSLPH